MGYLDVTTNSSAVRRYFCRITILDYETELPIAKVEGRVLSGNISIKASSPIRRTGSLNFIFDSDLYGENMRDGILGIRRKVSISLGESHLDNIRGKYLDDITWHKQGYFIITQMSTSFSGQEGTVSLQFIDKMGMLNGTCGGTISSAVSLHDKIVIAPDGSTTTFYPKIKEIIYEVVHHLGGENPSKIIISDIPDQGRQVVSWGGTTPVWFSKNSGAFRVGGAPTEHFQKKFGLGEDIGYMSTDLTYPGELIMKPGSTVMQILSEIAKTLGNFEFFYDVEGLFHFRRILNFERSGQTPLLNIEIDGKRSISSTPFNISANHQLQKNFTSKYIPTFADAESSTNMTLSESVIRASINPNLSNIKNDFVVWGTKKDSKEKQGQDVRYHLAIDKKPIDSDSCLCRKNIWEVRRSGDRQVLRYISTPGTSVAKPSSGQAGGYDTGPVSFQGEYSQYTTYYLNQSVYFSGTQKYYKVVVAPIKGISKILPTNTTNWQLIIDEAIEVLLHSPALTFLPSGTEDFNWREELYRQALIAFNTSEKGSHYDQELLTEWRKIFNPFDKTVDPDLVTFEAAASSNPHWSTFKKEWDDYFSQKIPWSGYTVDICRKPQNIKYWLDIISTSSSVGQYSIDKIGKRTVAIEDNKINEVLTRDVPDIVFIDGRLDKKIIKEISQEMLRIGQVYCLVQPSYIPYFEIRNSFGTCYEAVRELFYNHLMLNIEVSLTTLPFFDLEVNRIVQLKLPNAKIDGHYIVNAISVSLGDLSTMQVQLSEAAVIV